jgi:hypothetical protein
MNLYPLTTVKAILSRFRFLLVVFLSVCLFLQNATAQSVHHIKDDVMLNKVYGFGKYAGLLQTARWSGVEGKFKVIVSLLTEENVPDVEFFIPERYDLKKVLSHSKFGVALYQYNRHSLFVKINEEGFQNVEITSKDSLLFYGKEIATVHQNGSVSLVRNYYHKYRREERGTEHILLSSSLELISHTYTKIDTYEYRLLDVLSTQEGFGVTKEAVATEDSNYHFVVDLFDDKGRLHHQVLLKDSFSLMPMALFHDTVRHKWLLGGLIFDGFRRNANLAHGHFLFTLDAENELQKSFSPWKEVVPVIRKTNEKQFLEEANVPVQLHFSSISKSSDAYQVVLESYVITDGKTLVKSGLKLYEEGESVLTLLDLVVESYNEQGIRSSQRIIEKQRASILTMAYFRDEPLLERAAYYSDRGLFPVLRADSSSIRLLDVDKENVYLGYLNWVSDSSFRTERVNFIAPDTIVYSEKEMEFINKSRILKKLVNINNKADTLYAKSEAPAQKLAYSFTKADFSPDMYEDRNAGLSVLSPKRIFWYEIMREKRLIYYQYITCP